MSAGLASRLSGNFVRRSAPLWPTAFIHTHIKFRASQLIMKAKLHACLDRRAPSHQSRSQSFENAVSRQQRNISLSLSRTIEETVAFASGLRK